MPLAGYRIITRFHAFWAFDYFKRTPLPDGYLNLMFRILFYGVAILMSKEPKDEPKKKTIAK